LATAAVQGSASRIVATIASWIGSGPPVEVGQQLDAEADVALLVEGDVAHPSRKPGARRTPRGSLDHVLAGLGEARLDDEW
jgi:hypothetical protein